MEWYEKLYTREYIDFCGFALPEQTVKEARFIKDALGLQSGLKLLDLCCGFGRHTFEIAKISKCDIVGLDLSDDFLALAQKNNHASNITYVKGDMRNIPYREEFDAVTNLFTSFGFFEDDEENERVIQQVNRSLKPDGLFLLDYENKFHFVNNDVKKKEHDWKKLDENRYGLISNRYDVHNEREILTVEILENGEILDTISYNIRLYSFPELKKMMMQNGFEILKTWGDFDKTEYSVSSRRLITLSKKIKSV